MDLFCGIGGLTHRLRSSGRAVSAGYDIDPSCRYAYEANNESTSVEADIRDVRFGDIAPHYANAASLGIGRMRTLPAVFRPYEKELARRRGLLPALGVCQACGRGRARIISIRKCPRPRLAWRIRRVRTRWTRSATTSTTACCLARTTAYTKLGADWCRWPLYWGEISLPVATTGRPTVADFVGHQPSIEAGETHPNDRAHASMPLSARNLRRIRQSSPGGSWKDWDENLVNPCHTTTYYPAPYGRMRWDAPAPTITTQFCYYSTGRFGHPEQDRAISVREGALLQTFPADYDLIPGGEPFLMRNLARHIGNAVPVKLAHCIGQRIMEAGHRGRQRTLERSGQGRRGRRDPRQQRSAGRHGRRELQEDDGGGQGELDRKHQQFEGLVKPLSSGYETVERRLVTPLPERRRGLCGTGRRGRG